MKNMFNKQGSEEMIARINNLTADSKPQWGKMNAAEMLAHCSVAYEMVYTDKHPKPGAVGKFFLKMLVKSAVVGPKPYSKNGRTAPQFLVGADKDFAEEKKRLIDYIRKTQELGADHFHNKESHSFGPLTKDEWNVSFSKHLDHHLTQFGV